MAVNYTVALIEEQRAPFTSYRYRLFRAGVEFAIFSHDYRGECECLRMHPSGRVETLPFAQSCEFLTGGGPIPLGLSEEAARFLETLAQTSQRDKQPEAKAG